MQSNKRNELVTDHISTHSENAVMDQAAVNTLKNLFLDGRINTNFSCNDKWPNHDGTFEFVSNPGISRSPEQNFIVQIKGTDNYKEVNGIISYSLKSLAFPAYIAEEITADPGILFVVLNPCIRGQQRFFWKYLSPQFIQPIDFSKESTTIKFNSDEEIKNTNESVNIFCSKLQKIIEMHLFSSKLDKEKLTKEDAVKIVKERCEEISSKIDRFQNNNSSRDVVSRKIINELYDLCYAVIILNAIKQTGYASINERAAWELAQFNYETNYLSNFLKGLKYIGSKIPDDGQSERLMLKYYNYLWEIRKFLNDNYQLAVLDNLENFPLDIDRLDQEYYEMVVASLDTVDFSTGILTTFRYFIQKKTPFFVNGKRYFEITLQLAELNATKFNRITVYSKQNIASHYSIQIAYIETEISLFNIKSKIKVVTGWKVSINPACLNKLAKILCMDIKLSKNYGEYETLMKFLTQTGMNLFELINLSDNNFQNVLDYIYGKTNTVIFKDVLIKLRTDYSFNSMKKGKYTIRYILLTLREEVLESVLFNTFDPRYRLTDSLNLSSKCLPFEKNPFISNLAGRKTSKANINSLLEIAKDSDEFNVARPYLLIESMINNTGELYFNSDLIGNKEEIDLYNSNLDRWECKNGFSIKEENGLLFIDSYEQTLLFILDKLLMFSQLSNGGQKEYNQQFIKQCNINFEDKLKKTALENSFVNSHVMFIYGAAGTGKTTLINYISTMMNKSRKLFLTKTHAALQKLKRCIENPGLNYGFQSIDSFIKSNETKNYEIIFVDECSTIDNRTMKMLLEKIDENTLLVLSGDIYQIESIDFGNWFYYAKKIIKNECAVIELLKTWRTESNELKELWDEVREKRPAIIEKLAMDGPFSADIGEEIFEPYDEDEIVLCLNYDGKFGLNNINLYFQNANTKSEAYTWAEWTFKVGDPIIFLDTNLSSLLYNNLKGRIINIVKTNSYITFTLDIDAIFTEQQCINEKFEFVSIMNNKTRICLKVFANNESSAEEEENCTIIPFQIAYAVSIHKAQGLEYNSVKVIIPSYNEEKISHSIFYTAITRAKEKLKIFWSAETMKSIIEHFNNENAEQHTFEIIEKKLNTHYTMLR